MRRSFNSLEDVGVALRDLDDRVNKFKVATTPVPVTSSIPNASGSSALTLGPQFAKLNQPQIWTTTQTFQDDVVFGGDLLSGAGGSLGSHAKPWLDTYTGRLIVSLIKPFTDATNAIIVTDAGEINTIVQIDTTNKRVGINKAPGAANVDAAGAINTDLGYKIGGVGGINNVGQIRIVGFGTVGIQYKDWSGVNQSATIPVITTGTEDFQGGILTGIA